MEKSIVRVAAVAAGVVFCAGLRGQGATPDPYAPPPTKLENYEATTGAVVTVGHEDLGTVAGISVDVREMRTPQGRPVRGIIVQVTESQDHREVSYVDSDELGALVRGVDTMLQVTANPTQFKTFEMRYSTKGNLELTATTDARNGIVYAVKAGRLATAWKSGLTPAEMQQVRTMLENAREMLMSLPDN